MVRRAWLACIALALGPCGLALACDGEPELKAALTPSEGQHVAYYRIGSKRCPYWVPAFQAADGQKGGYQCVNRVTLREMCAIADCEKKPGTPNDLPPGLIDRSKGGPGWKGVKRGDD